MKVQLNDLLMEKINGGVEASPILADQVSLDVPADPGLFNVLTKGPGSIAAIETQFAAPGTGVGSKGINQALDNQ